MDQLLNELPKLEPEDREVLDAAITFDELSGAVQQFSVARAPGIFGLPAEFCKKFWGVLGNDILRSFVKSLCFTIP